MKEKKNLEFKSTITNTFLKTVSAYSNFGDGEIWFGINDDGSVCGIEHPETVCIDIENRINDSISPKPKFEMRVDTSKNIIFLLFGKEHINRIYIKVKRIEEMIPHPLK